MNEVPAVVEVCAVSLENMTFEFAKSQREKATTLRLSRRFMGLSPDQAAQAVNEHCQVLALPDRAPYTLTGDDILRFERNELIVSNHVIRACVTPSRKSATADDGEPVTAA